MWHSILPLALAGTSLGDLTGTWTGWLDLDDGDVPVRIHLERVDAEWLATIDLPAAGQHGIRIGAVREGERGIQLLHPTADSPAIRIELGPRGEERLGGPVDWGGVPGRASLSASDLRLSPTVPEDVERFAGLYGLPGSPAVVVRARPWGELVVVDPNDGSERTVFRGEDGTLFVGPALYVATPVNRELTFLTSEEGDPLALLLRDSGGETRLPRRALTRRSLTVARDGVKLDGTLLLPDVSDGPVGCAVLAGGSDWSTRRSVEGYALVLAALGVATVVYDKRGHGSSEGEVEVPFSTTADDLVAWADHARREEGIDADRVGYFGISRGGWYGALAASRDPRTAFFLDVVGPAVSPIRQETAARLARLRERGATADEVARAARYLELQWAFARTGQDGQEYLAERHRVAERGWLDVLHGPDSLDPSAWRWLKLNGDFDPSRALRSISAPRLAVFGEHDVAVAAPENAPKMRKLLAGSNGRVVVLDGVDHGLRPVLRDGEGARLGRHESPGRHADLWPLVREWLDSIGVTGSVR